MTADERYAQAKTRKELFRMYDMDRKSAETFEFLGACDRAYAKHYERLFKEEMEGKKKHDSR